MTKKQKIELGADLCAALRVIGKKVPLKPGDRPTYDATIRYLLRTHPDTADQVVDELTL